MRCSELASALRELLVFESVERRARANDGRFSRSGDSRRVFRVRGKENDETAEKMKSKRQSHALISVLGDDDEAKRLRRIHKVSDIEDMRFKASFCVVIVPNDAEGDEDIDERTTGQKTSRWRCGRIAFRFCCTRKCQRERRRRSLCQRALRRAPIIGRFRLRILLDLPSVQSQHG